MIASTWIRDESERAHPSHRQRVFDSNPPLKLAVTSRHQMMFFEGQPMILLEIHEFYRFVGNVLSADLEFLDQLPGSARIAKPVLDADRPIAASQIWPSCCRRRP